MNKNIIKQSFDKIEPDNMQKDRMFNEITVSLNNGGLKKSVKNKKKFILDKAMYFKAACIICFVLILAITFQSVNNSYKEPDRIIVVNENTKTPAASDIIDDTTSEPENDPAYEVTKGIEEPIKNSTPVSPKITAKKTDDPSVTSPKDITDDKSSDIKRLNSYGELYDILYSNSQNNTTSVVKGTMVAKPAATHKATKAPDDIADAPPPGVSSSDPEYSDTNLQVVGVQEADIIKTDGKYIYAISNSELYIVSAANGKLELISSISRQGKKNDLIEMYVNQNRIIVLVSIYNSEYHWNKPTMGIEIYDITNRVKPKILNSIGQSGYYISSRMIGDDLYLITSQNINYYNDNIKKDKPETYVPQITINGKINYLNYKDIYVGKDFKYNNYNYNMNYYLIVSGFSTSKSGELISSKTLLGYGNNIYASVNNLYVSAYNYSDTKLFRFSLNKGKVALDAEGSVPGYTLNQFSMDEYKNVFRIVTTTNTNTSYNCLYTLNDKLEIIGKIEKLAPGERVYSVRFDGDIGYFVTFRQVDPLFTVDLKDPKKPKVLHSLKIPGFSEYLHKFTDDLLFGLGKDADENTGISNYIKLSMFDVSNPTDVLEKHKLILDGDTYSEALYNHKAILIDSKKNIIAFPSDNEYMVYSYDKSKGFIKKAAITLNTMFDEYTGLYYDDYVMRGIFIGNYIYVMGGKSISSYNINDYQIIDYVKFN